MERTEERRERRVDLAVQVCGLAAAMAGAVALGVVALPRGAAPAAAAIVYGTTLVALFACSIAHALARARNSTALRLLDHAAIYLLIAGTYTPFCLLAIGGRAGALLLAVVWLAALAGIAARAVRRLRPVGIGFYVVLGWSGLAQIDSLVARLPVAALVLLAVGGVIYTAAAPLHRRTSLRYHDAIWHASVVVAAACHYAAVTLSVAAA